MPATTDPTVSASPTTSLRWRLPEGAFADVYDPRCASRQVLDRIGGRWTTLVTGVLSEGPKRFNELRRRVTGVSPKVLSSTLRSLERDGYVTRTVHPTVPPSVEYALTDLGGELELLHRTVRSWAETHIEAIESARLVYDEADAATG